MAWTRVVDTGLEAPDDAVLDVAAGTPVRLGAYGDLSYPLAPKAGVLLVAVPGGPLPPAGARPPTPAPAA